MTDAVRDAYDAMAEPYTKLAIGEIDRRPLDRDWLATFAELAACRDGAAADLGCGPGHVVDHLTELGLTVIGYDLSAGLLAEAHGTPFDHAVVTAYASFPATIANQLADAGFTDVEIAVRDPLDGERPLEHGTVLAQKPGT